MAPGEGRPCPAIAAHRVSLRPEPGGRGGPGPGGGGAGAGHALQGVLQRGAQTQGARQVPLRRQHLGGKGWEEKEKGVGGGGRAWRGGWGQMVRDNGR